MLCSRTLIQDTQTETGCSHCNGTEHKCSAETSSEAVLAQHTHPSRETLNTTEDTSLTTTSLIFFRQMIFPEMSVRVLVSHQATLMRGSR